MQQCIQVNSVRTNKNLLYGHTTKMEANVMDVY